MTVYFLNSADYDLLQDCSTREAFEEVLFAGHSIHQTFEGAQRAALEVERDICDDTESNEEPSLNWEEQAEGTWRTQEEDSVGGLVYLIRAMELLD